MIITTKSSITDKDLSIMVSSARRLSRRRERQRIHAPSMQALPILMKFIGKESQK